jgi:hypothetical protein
MIERKMHRLNGNNAGAVRFGGQRDNNQKF